MPDIRWIKLTTDIFDDEKIRLIEALPESDTILVVWVKLLCQAGKVNADGYIFLSRDIPFSEENLATLFGRPLNTIRLALSTFQRLQMITIDEKGVIFLPNWSKHQNLEALEHIREQARLRQQKHRAQISVTTSHALVTKPSRDVTQEKENKKENKNTNPIVPLSVMLPDWLDKKTWDEFLEMRKAKRNSPTPHAMKLLISKLDKLRLFGDDPTEVLNRSIISGWPGVYPLNKQNEKVSQSIVNYAYKAVN